ncbi:MAG: hypothetical protein ACLR1P_02435 [Oscillospiraceae bacterium]
MGKTIWGLFYVWVKMMLLCCEIEPQGSRGARPASDEIFALPLAKPSP